MSPMGQCFSLGVQSFLSKGDREDEVSPSDESLSMIRTTTFDVLNAETHKGSELAGEVWVADVDDDKVSHYWVDNYSKKYVPSSAATSIDYFISHTWEDDGSSKGMENVPTWENLDSLMEFGWRKSVAFQNVVRTIMEMKKHPDRQHLRFWLDKACIPQYDEELKKNCISSLEMFINNSDGLIVLMSPRYPKRLWCVYEVACFLCSKNLDKVFINFRSFASDDNRSTYVKVIREFSIDNCECKEEFDRTILEAKVKQYYKSKDHFSVFVQDCLLSLIIRDFYSYPPMIKTADLFKEHVGPFLGLLKELEESHTHDDNPSSRAAGSLSEAFSSFDVVKIYQYLEYNDDLYTDKLNIHLSTKVYPLLKQRRRHACNDEGLSLYSG